MRNMWLMKLLDCMDGCWAKGGVTGLLCPPCSSQKSLVTAARGSCCRTCGRQNIHTVIHGIMQGAGISDRAQACAVVAACKGLSSLSLVQCTVETAALWPQLASSCAALQRLTLDGVDAYSSSTGRGRDEEAAPASFAALATRLPALQELVVKGLVRAGELLLQAPRVGGRPVVARVTELDTEVKGGSLGAWKWFRDMCAHP